MHTILIEDRVRKNIYYFLKFSFCKCEGYYEIEVIIYV